MRLGTINLKIAGARERQRKAEEKAAAHQALKNEKAHRVEERAAARAAMDEARVAAARARLAAKERLEQEKALQRTQRLADKEAILQAQIKERARKLQEREEDKAARAKAKDEARAASEKAKEAATEARAKARAEAILQKEAQVEAKKRAQSRRKQIEAELNETRKRQEKKLSATVTELLTGLIQVLCGRTGVAVTRLSQGPTLPPDELVARAEDVPSEILNWYREVGPIDFRWEVPVDPSSAPFPPGGHLCIPPLSDLKWTPRGRYLLPTATDGPPEEWTSLEEYLLRGLSTLFTWQNARLDLEPLSRTAVPRFTPAQEIAERLLEKGLQEKVVRALLQLLESNAHLILHESESEEGLRRREILNAAALQGELSDSLLDAISDGPPVRKKEWRSALEEHVRFLDAAGGGGSWSVSLKDGLPHAEYRSKTDPTPPGQADFAKENLQSLTARSARLAFANLCGARAVGMVFASADLKGSCFSYGRFDTANFQGADLSGCDFSGARLASADFRKAVLIDTNFEKADLTGANFGGALTKGTRFGGANVRGIRY